MRRLNAEPCLPTMRPAHDSLARPARSIASALALSSIICSCSPDPVSAREPAVEPALVNYEVEIDRPARRAIVILLDAARADRFSCYGYSRETTPNMDRLASRGMRFDDHYANGVNTRSSMPTLLYSRFFAHPVFPKSSRVPVYRPTDLFRMLDEDAVSFPEVLSDSGIYTIGISAHQWFVMSSEFAQAFDQFHDLPREVEYPSEYRYPRANQVVDLAIDWIDEAGPDESYMLYLHFMDPHFPHLLDEDAAEFFGESHYSAERFDEKGMPHDLSRVLTGRDRAYMDAIYDGSLKYTDRELGRLFDHLEKEGLFDDTLIMITADHGEQLLHRPNEFTHGNWREPVARIPMIVTCPDCVPVGETDAITQGVDVLPTLVHAMGVTPQTGYRPDGTSLIELINDVERESAHSRHGSRVGRMKFIHNMDDDDQIGEFIDALSGDRASAEVYLESLNYLWELYDLDVDPAEIDNIWDTSPLSYEIALEYAESVGPAFELYQSSKRDEIPSGGFAILPSELEVSMELPEVGRPATLEDIRALEFHEGWSHYAGRHDSFVMGEGGAGWIDISVEVPSGEYALSVSVDGSGLFSAPGLPTPVELEGKKILGGKTKIGRLMEVGNVQVTGMRFEAQLRPAEDTEFFRLNNLSFEPVGAASSGLTAEEEAERLEALKALGYVPDDE